PPAPRSLHDALPISLLALVPVTDRRVDRVVPLLEDVRPDLHPIADLAFDGVPAAIQLGVDSLDDDAPAGVDPNGHERLYERAERDRKSTRLNSSHVK